MSEPLKARKTKRLEEGKYTGKIISFARDTEYYDYMRYKIEVDKEDITLEVSYPTDISFMGDGEPSSSHAKMLCRFGIELNDTKDYFKEIEKSILNKEVSFLIQNIEKKNKETGEKQTFAQILRESVKPK